MHANSRRPMLLRLGALFLCPLLAFLFLLAPHVDGITVSLFVYFTLLLGFGLFAAPTMATGVPRCIALGVALALGMLLVHVVVGVGGCTFILLAHG